jgi:hypothetical protein
LTAGDIGHRYLLRALADMGRSDVVFNLHCGTNNPGYGYILNQGATALTEAWDANTSSSQDHFMLGHITEWFYHDLAGIQSDPAVPGFQHVIIRPAFVGGITWVNASYASVRGTIVSDWTLTNNLATLNVTIPVGSTGSIYLSTLGTTVTNLVIKESGTTIWQNGAATGSAVGVAFDHVQGTGSQAYMVWTVGSGSYQFAWNVFPPPTPVKWFGAAILSMFHFSTAKSLPFFRRNPPLAAWRGCESQGVTLPCFHDVCSTILRGCTTECFHV